PAHAPISALALHDALPISPANGRAQGHDDAVMGSARTLRSVALQRQVMLAHDPQHPLGIDDRLTFEPALPVDQRSDAAIAIGWTDRKSTRLNSSHVKISYA